MQTLSQEMASADAALIVELVEPMPALPADSATGGPAAFDPTATAKFRVVEVLRGEEKLAGAKEIDVVYFGQDQPPKKFFVTGIAAITPDKLEWTTPVPLSDRAVEYIGKLPTLPAEGIERLLYFQQHLEDDDPLLAQDSYDEFARSPYADIVALGPQMNHDKLIEWINDPSVGPTGRRLYLTMLGVCAKPEDVGMLESFLHYDYQLMKPALATALSTSAWGLGNVGGAGLLDEIVHAEERRKKESLDALAACYLKLKGPDGLALINEKFLGNPTAEYKYLHSAIMALRFHGEETDVIPREKLLDSMRLALSHREFADQVIPDLTRWEDWEVLPQLVTMFKEASADDWIRQPVVSYLLVAAEQPGDVGAQGKAALTELESLDPQTVERARSLQAFSFLAKAAAAPAAAAATEPATNDPAAATASAVPGAAEQPAATESPAAAETASAAAPKKNAAERTAALAAAPLPAPSKLKLIGVPLVAATVLLVIFAILLRGTDPRSSTENP
jgi:hypothetical protein